MLLTIISALGGAAINVLPSIIGYFLRREQTVQQRDKYKHEIEMLRLEAEYKLNETRAKVVGETNDARISERDRIRAADSSSHSSGFWGFVRASIRPVITYSLFISFVAIKGFAFYHATFIIGYDVLMALDYIWDPETQAIFAAVVGFWFGSRAIEKFS